jgi:hypothetical protein
VSKQFRNSTYFRVDEGAGVAVGLGDGVGEGDGEMLGSGLIVAVGPDGAGVI